MPNAIEHRSWKMQFFNIITFLNESKFYDEERNELS